jgi:hypothetical protein
MRRHEAVWRVREPQVENAGVWPVRGYRGDPPRSTGDGRQYLVAVAFEGDTERFAQDPVVVTQNKSHRPAPFGRSLLRAAIG